VEDNTELILLKKKLADQEKQLYNLRLSRRILMNLLEQTVKEKNMLCSELEKKRGQGIKRQKREIKTNSFWAGSCQVVDYIKLLKNKRH